MRLRRREIWRSGFGYCVAVALMAATQAAHAQLVQGDQSCEEPIDIAGDELEVLDNVATLTGDVRVVQCESILTTAKLVGTQNDAGDYESLEAVSRVRYADAGQAIASDKAFYDLSARRITFTGDVIVTQGEQVMVGGRLVYWVDTGKILFTAPEGSRVRGIIQTDSLEAQF